jgi:ATP-binding cassette subfamily G (WHITE) protein 5 (sterolin 1)
MYFRKYLIISFLYWQNLVKKIYFLVCLSTVDRRSRERFIESNNQISALVEKFKLEGGAYR